MWGLVAFRPGLFALSLLLSLISSAVVLIPGWISQKYYNEIMGHHPSAHRIATLIELLIAYPVVTGLIGFGSMSVNMLSGAAVSTMARVNLFEMLLDSPYAVRQMGAGYVIGLLRDDADVVCSFVFALISTVVKIASVVMVMAVLVRVDLQLTLYVFIPLVLIFLITQSFGKVLITRNRKSREATTDVMSTIIEVFGAVQPIQIAGAQKHVVQRFRKLNLDRRSAFVQERLSNSIVGALSATTSSVGMGMIILLAGSFVKSGSVSIGDLALFSGYLGIVMGSISGLSGVISQSKKVDVSLERLTGWAPDRATIEQALFKHRPVFVTGILPDFYAPAAAYQPLERLAVSGITYQYPNSLNGITDVDFQVKRGSITVVTGGMGSGKSTLLRALLGLIRRDSGSIHWNHTEVNNPSDFLRPPGCAYTPQVPLAFNSTVKDNILLGAPHDAERMERAISHAVLEADLAAVPSGVETMLGSHGVGLSGGQKQRLSIARMFATDADLMVLDDPTSALDQATSAKIWHNILSLAGDKTFIIVTNNEEVLRRADNIIIMDGGRIRACGVYSDLYSSDPYLPQIVEAQAAAS